jgi:hypothetical protein
MAGAGYKLFATGDVLTAAQVNTYLNEQTVMVFANAAARTSALTSVLAEGMVSYLQDTNAVEVYNGSAWVGVSGAGDVTEVQAGTGISVASGTGPIPVVTNTMATAIDAKGDLVVGTGADTFSRLAVGGTNGHTLQVDSSTSTGLKWAAASSGGMTLISTTTLTGASISLTSIPGTYKNLQLVVRNWRPADDNKGLLLRFNGDSAANRHTQQKVFEASAQTFTGTYVDTGYATDNTTDSGIVVLNFTDYANTATWKYCEIISFVSNETTVTSYNYRKIFGAYNQTGAITSLTLLPESGNFNAGSALLYGVA